MTTERNRSNAPHPAEYAARQDELKRSLEIIYTTAESARAQDMLGGLAIRLASAVVCRDGSLRRSFSTIPAEC